MINAKLGDLYQEACESLYVPFSPNQARDLCLRVLKENGLGDWLVIWKISDDFVAACDNDDKTVILSLVVLNESKSGVLDAIRHEVAHALVGRTGHDTKWAEMAVRLGCCPNRGSFQAMTALLQDAANKIRDELTDFTVSDCLICEQRHLVLPVDLRR